MQPTKKRNGRKIAGIVLLVTPSALILGAIILYAVLNFALASTKQSDTLSGTQSPVVTAANVLLFLLGALSTLAWLPCLIIGIILLATQKK